MQCGLFGCEYRRGRRVCSSLAALCPSEPSSSASSSSLLPGKRWWPLIRKQRLLRYLLIMGSAGLLLLLTLLISNRSSALPNAKQPINDRPVIGVLAQETHFENLVSFGGSYIAASYVKTLEAAGARVIPIRINLTDEDYVKLFKAINGILLPGGAVDLKSSRYARISKIFYDLAIAANDKGDYFPIWGTCLGFEELTVLTSDEVLLTLTTRTEDVSLPLNFTESALHSKLFKNIPPSLYKVMSSMPITANYHQWSLSMQNFTQNEKLRKFYNVLTTNSDGELEFISTMEVSLIGAVNPVMAMLCSLTLYPQAEISDIAIADSLPGLLAVTAQSHLLALSHAYEYPIYGVQWHPEKNPFEWRKTTHISHAAEAIYMTFYMADFFVNEARKSQHEYTEDTAATQPLIYTYCPTYTGNISVFEQMYFF